MVSVIVPVFNTAAYLDECIRSVVGQTCRDLEILLIDDCSTDGSSALLDQWSERDGRIRVIHKEKNAGVSDSRNLGLHLSRGEYISFVDSDDRIEPDMYEKMLLTAKQTDADAVFCGRKEFGREKTTEVLTGFETGRTATVEEALQYCLPRIGERRLDAYIWNKIFHRRAVFRDGKESVLFDTSYSYCEDALWLVQVLLGCKKIAFRNEALYHYRISRPDNAYHQLREQGGTEHNTSAVKAYEEIDQMLQRGGFSCAGNAYQRALYHRYLGMKKTIQGEGYRQFADGYLKDLLKWCVKEKSFYGVIWAGKKMMWYCKMTLKTHLAALGRHLERK